MGKADDLDEPLVDVDLDLDLDQLTNEMNASVEGEEQFSSIIFEDSSVVLCAEDEAENPRPRDELYDDDDVGDDDTSRCRINECTANEDDGLDSGDLFAFAKE